MSEFFLVLPEGQTQHVTLEEAAATRDNLNRHVEGKKFRIYRCKCYLHPARHFTKMVELLGEIMEHGLTPDLRDRAIVVLTTIGNRNNETPHLSVNRSIPEFHAPGAT